jgi:hypothetical protein
MRRLFFLFFALFISSASALTDKEIQGFINEAIKAGSGEVIIPPGTHLITHGLVIKDAKKLRLIGYDKETSILKLPPLAFAESGEAAAAGATRLSLRRSQNLAVGMMLHLECDGEIEPFTKKPKPYQLAFVKELSADAVVLRDPLKFPVPAGTLIRDEHAPNLIELRGTCDGVTIEKLTLDGARTPADPALRGHAQLCGIFATGPYNYEQGPTGPRVRGVRVSRCIIQNCFGRGVAFYSVEDSTVEDCTIMDCNDEAVDLDHFTQKTIVQHNHLARCNVGVELNDANDCAVLGNEVRECGTGINHWRWCKMPDLNERNRIEGNTFERTKGNAIQLATGTAHTSVINNDIRDSARNGISAQGTGTTLRDNRISGSGLQDIAKPK